MSTVSKSRPPGPPGPQPDPYRYGWRYVPVKAPDGSDTFDQVPLTLVDWNLPGVRPLGPDIAVFFDVKRYDEWETFSVAAVGARPALVVEVTSRSTRKNDPGAKVKFYIEPRSHSI